jgi:serine/threonine protein kinase
MAPTRCEHCQEELPPGARFCPDCGKPAVAQVDFATPLPARLAAALGQDYQVLGELGRGGFSIVFSVRDLRLKRYLAVKVMRPELLTAEGSHRRFQREAQLVAQLDHPNILPISFAGEGAGLSFFAMPRVSGETLQQCLERERRLPIDAAHQLFVDLANGLAYAHDRQVVHRDIKPANIMLDSFGKALLVDFGIAKGLSEDGSTLSVTGAVIGTPEYMSPEQASGSRRLDHRSDIYGLGVVAFQAVTGKLPFTGTGLMDIAQKKRSSVAPSVRYFRPGIPAMFAEAIAKCLERDVTLRCQSGHEAAASV